MVYSTLSFGLFAVLNKKKRTSGETALTWGQKRADGADKRQLSRSKNRSSLSPASRTN